MHDLNQKAEGEWRKWSEAAMRYLSTCMLTPRLYYWIVEVGVVVDADFTLRYPMMQILVGRIVSGDDDKYEAIAHRCYKAEGY